MTVPHTQIFYLLFIAVIIGLGVVSYQAVDLEDPQVQANMDNIVFLLEQQTKTSERHEFIVDKIVDQTRNISELRQEMESQDELIIREVVAIKMDIKSKFPQASNIPDQGQTTAGTTPFLTLKMDKIEFLAGEKLIFSGTAHPTHAVLITIKLADRSLDSVGVSKKDIINGQYIAEFQTKLDSPKGTWTAYARQLDDQTNTISFTLE